MVACAAQSSSSVRLASVQQMMACAGVMVLIRFNQLRYVLYGFEVSPGQPPLSAGARSRNLTLKPRTVVVPPGSAAGLAFLVSLAGRSSFVLIRGKSRRGRL